MLNPCSQIFLFPTKQEEIDKWNNFLASLEPGTYLHSMLAKTGPEVEAQIRSDIAIGPLIRTLTEVLDSLTERLTNIKEAIESLKL